MKLTPLNRLLSLLICQQLIASPMVGIARAEEAKKSNSAGEMINSGAEILSSGIGALGKIWQATQGQNMGPSPQVAGDMQQLLEQQKPQPVPRFNLHSHAAAVQPRLIQAGRN
jgi:hypothetical protein